MKNGRRNKTVFVALAVGFLFALGLGLSGMTRPQKIISFLDIFGEWDPSLLFVMGGALGVHAILYRLIIRRPNPLLADKFQIPERRKIDFKLLAGAMLFGLGWGMAGFCPAPALTATASLRPEPFVFVISMLLGIYGASRILNNSSRS